MLTDYIKAVMALAEYEFVSEEGEAPYIFATIEHPEFLGIWAKADSYPECQVELQSTIEGWLILGFRLGHHTPILDGIDLNIDINPTVEAA
jgi:hypothetical protein